MLSEPKEKHVQARVPLHGVFLAALLLLTSCAGKSMKELAITQVDPVAAGTTRVLIATATFSDDTTADISSQVTWTSADPTIAEVSNQAGKRGLLSAKRMGQVTVLATVGEVQANTSVNVSAPTLTQVRIDPPVAAIAMATTQTFTARAVYSDGSTEDVSKTAAWTSAAEEVATIGVDSGISLGKREGQTTIRATFKTESGSAALVVSSAAIQSLAILPTNATIAKGTTQQFVAMGLFSGGVQQDLTSVVTWASASEAIAAVSNTSGTRGRATSQGKGTTSITAEFGGKKITANLIVSDATLVSLALSPPAPVLAKGTAQQITATGTFSDGTTQDLSSQATWTSTNTAIATVGGNTGQVNAAGTGAATITASFGGKSATSSVQVTDATLQSIAISPPTATFAKGTVQVFTATGTFSDGSTQDLTSLVTWAASDSSVASLQNLAGQRGRATGLGTGTSTVTATMGTISGSASLTVSSAQLLSIAVTPPTAVLAPATTQQFTATGTFSDQSTQNLTSQVVWTSSDTATASLPGTAGLARGVASGSATVTATYSGMSASGTVVVTNASLESITVTSAATSIGAGDTHQFIATGTFSGGSTQDLSSVVTWSSGSSTVASISNAAGSRGLATGLAVGSATISASFGGKSGSKSLTVGAGRPVVTAITPRTGSRAGFETVRIYGRNFVSGAALGVKFGTTASSSVTFVSSTELQVVTPTGRSVGAVDVTVTNPDGQSGGNPSLYTYTLSVSFGTPATYNTTGGVNEVAIADFNSDGKPDVAAAGADTIRLWLGLGDGTLGSEATIAATATGRIATADMNGDGKADLVTLSAAAKTVGVHLGKGDGTFEPEVKYVHTVNNTTSPRLADFNGDGKPDLFTGSTSDSLLLFMLNKGDGTFAAPTTRMLAGASSLNTVGDFNGDGKVDLVVNNGGSNNATIWLGKGDGTFDVGTSAFITNSSPLALAAGDFNRDGKSDLVNLSSNLLAIDAIHPAFTTFYSVGAYRTNSASAMCVGDLNKDELLDVVVVNPFFTSMLRLYGMGNGALVGPNATDPGVKARVLACADLNNDGLLDLIMTDPGGASVSVMRNTSN